MLRPFFFAVSRSHHGMTRRLDSDGSKRLGPEDSRLGAFLWTPELGRGMIFPWNDGINNVLLVKIEGPVWYTIYHHLPVVKGVSPNPSINQPTNGKRTSMDGIMMRLWMGSWDILGLYYDIL